VVRTTYDTTVMVLRWWRKAKGPDWAREFFQGKDLPPIYPKDITAFLGLRITKKRADELFAPHLGSALGYIKEHIAGDTPEYVKLALEDALNKFSAGTSIKPEQNDLEAPYTAPIEPERSLTAQVEHGIEQLEEAFRNLGLGLLKDVVSSWPVHGTKLSRKAVKALTWYNSDGGGAEGFYRVIRWAGPSMRSDLKPRIGQAFVRFQHHAGGMASGPFARFTIYYRPKEFIEKVDGASRSHSIRREEREIRISDGIVLPIESHMFLLGQEYVWRVLPSVAGEDPDVKKRERRKSGYPLIVACSLPDDTGNIEGIVLRQTDRDLQVLSSRVYLEKMATAEFQKSPMGDESAADSKSSVEPRISFFWHAFKNAALYPIARNGTVPGLADGERILQLLDERFRNLEPLDGAPDGVGRYAITLQNPDH
jgi:hypothetical protein